MPHPRRVDDRSSDRAPPVDRPHLAVLRDRPRRLQRDGRRGVRVRRGRGYVDRAAQAEAQRPPADLLVDWRGDEGKARRRTARSPTGTKLFVVRSRRCRRRRWRRLASWRRGRMGLDVADALGSWSNRLSVCATSPTSAHPRLPGQWQAGPGRARSAMSSSPQPVLMNGRGDPDASNVVRGSALDFCQLVTQRRHPADLGITTTGDDAAEWVGIAQCFAGPGTGREGEGRSAVSDIIRIGNMSASTATVSRRCARCSRAVNSTTSTATTSPS